MVGGVGIQARNYEEHDTDQWLSLSGTAAISGVVRKHHLKRSDVLRHSGTASDLSFYYMCNLMR